MVPALQTVADTGGLETASLQTASLQTASLQYPKRTSVWGRAETKRPSADTNDSDGLSLFTSNMTVTNRNSSLNGRIHDVHKYWLTSVSSDLSDVIHADSLFTPSPCQ
ncbi:hypothetical protein BaRGS_00038970 [Batillaria attramentaria]|uniref:Uncharacterized protein n=1 Tax=Batillaria attramentaria TaxID=370345 RepID=A0ABD0J597_9CAEN